MQVRQNCRTETEVLNRDKTVDVLTSLNGQREDGMRIT